MKGGYIYILTNYHRTTFYIGVTNNLGIRVEQHRSGQDRSFTKKYNLTDLVYYEVFSSITDAIVREKQLKRWH